MSAFQVQPSVTAMLRDRIRAAKPVVGTFVKTTSPQTVELLGRSGLDFAVLDAEHAPYDVGVLDGALLAARAVGLPALVRIPDHRASFINSCLDMGADGVMVPHTRSAGDVGAIADAVKYGRGKRGFSPSGRAGGYGQLDPAAYRAQADASSIICCQIEDAEAMERLDEIAANDVLDCLFIGPADLGLSLGCDGPKDPRLAEAIRAIAEAGRRHRRVVGLFVPGPETIPDMIAMGITLFVCGSDQSMMLSGARRVAGEMARIAAE